MVSINDGESSYHIKESYCRNILDSWSSVFKYSIVSLTVIILQISNTKRQSR